MAEQQQCIMQLIVKGSEGIITLVSPSENEELKSENPINFMWTATGLKGPYTLTIKEIKKVRPMNRQWQRTGFSLKRRISKQQIINMG